MKKNLYFINIVHIIIVGLLVLTGILVNAFAPHIILPHISIPLLAAVSLVSMLAEYYMCPKHKRNWIVTAVLAGVTVAVLPLCAGLKTDVSFGILFVAGTLVFGITDILYRSIGERMRSGSYSKLAPLASAVMLYLASQCLQGLL